MTGSDLDAALMNDIGLHEEVRIYYVVDGWVAEYYINDGDSVLTEANGDTPMRALEKLFNKTHKSRDAHGERRYET